MFNIERLRKLTVLFIGIVVFSTTTFSFASVSADAGGLDEYEEYEDYHQDDDTYDSHYNASDQEEPSIQSDAPPYNASDQEEPSIQSDAPPYNASDQISNDSHSNCSCSNSCSCKSSSSSNKEYNLNNVYVGGDLIVGGDDDNNYEDVSVDGNFATDNGHNGTDSSNENENEKANIGQSISDAFFDKVFNELPRYFYCIFSTLMSIFPNSRIGKFVFAFLHKKQILFKG